MKRKTKSAPSAQSEPQPVKRAHTPTPWLRTADAQGICGLMHPSKRSVAVAWFSSTHRPTGDYVGEAEYEYGRPERQANAELIRKATHLYAAHEDVAAALRRMVDDLQYADTPTPATLQYAAIALKNLEKRTSEL